MANELAGSDPQRGAELAAALDRWRERLEAGVAKMGSDGLLRADSDPRALSLAIFASLQGGLLLTQTMESLESLDAALTGSLTLPEGAGASGLSWAAASLPVVAHFG
jgi:hypothetical protein